MVIAGRAGANTAGPTELNSNPSTPAIVREKRESPEPGIRKNTLNTNDAEIKTRHAESRNASVIDSAKPCSESANQNPYLGLLVAVWKLSWSI